MNPTGPQISGPSLESVVPGLQATCAGAWLLPPAAQAGGLTAAVPNSPRD